jgi:hypothetical protein
VEEAEELNGWELGAALTAAGEGEQKALLQAEAGVQKTLEEVEAVLKAWLRVQEEV